jgi:hypothetical protein
VSHFEAAQLPLPDIAAQLLKGLKKKRFNVVRLEPPRFGAFHLFPDAINPPGIHGVMRQGPFLQ